MTGSTSEPRHLLATAVFGAHGRMGQLVSRAIEDSDDLTLTARVGRDDDRRAARDADVIVDFTTPETVMDTIAWSLERRKHLVVGTTGLDDDAMESIAEMVRSTSPGPAVLVVPNFSKSAMLAKQLSEVAARHFDFVEMLDLTHDRKADAPSGTSLDTARGIDAVRRRAGIPLSPDATSPSSRPARGATVGDVRIHSIRMAGYVSHQEVMFTKEAELLSIRFDTLDRTAYLPEILRAVRIAPQLPGLHVGLASLYAAL